MSLVEVNDWMATVEDLPFPVMFACLDFMSLRIRALTEFFAGTYPRDFRATDIAPDWNPRPADAMERLFASRGSIGSHVIHYGRDRIERAGDVGGFPPIALSTINGLLDDLLAVWAEFATEAGIRLVDPGA